MIGNKSIKSLIEKIDSAIYIAQDTDKPMAAVSALRKCLRDIKATFERELSLRPKPGRPRKYPPKSQP